MNPPRADELDYIHFLIAAQKVFTCTEAARSAPGNLDPPAHDAFTRLLRREPPYTGALWGEARTLVEPERGLLVVDDTTLDKPYSKKMELVHRHWSGKHHRVVSGINLTTYSGMTDRPWYPPTFESTTSLATTLPRTITSGRCYRRPTRGASIPATCCSTPGIAHCRT
jgi:hypothetical protein